VFNRSDASTYAGNISGTGSLTKLGAGTLTLTGSSSFTGNTTVAAGTLVLGSGNALSSDLTVLSAATFDRAGYSQSFANAVVNGIVDDSAIGGLLTVTSMLSGTGVLNGDVLVTGVHAPGNSPGIQTFNGDLTYGNGADVNWELTSNTASNSSVVYDQIVLTGLADLTFSGSNLLWLSFNGTGSLVDWTNSFWDGNRAWTVFDLASGVTTGFGNLALGGSLLDANGLTLDASRGSFTLGQVGQDVVLNYTVAAVPEPSTMALALAGVAGYSLWRRRKRA
jgi:autotransporter-associated beta strand protein